MKRGLAAAVALVLLVPAPGYAHRLDEYLQATLITLSSDRVHVQTTLTPGVAVFPSVISVIDANGDGRLSDVEQRLYERRVLHDLSLSIDGRPLALRVVSSHFGSVAEMREGRAEIQLDLEALAPSGSGDRRLTFENRHQKAVSVYLVNTLVPADSAMRITAQSRSYEQASYEVRYAQNSASSRAPLLAAGAWVGFGNTVRLGMRHIAEGTDHLLFLLVLLLPAPLAAAGRRWGRYAGGRRGGVQLFHIVTAFTIGHSVTLAAATFGWVRAPSGMVEVLIAVSILVSGVHAVRPIFPGRERVIAAGFGLVHGLAFATAISGYGLNPWQAAITVFGFNVGIEMMQLIVLLVTVPWLALMARTRAYTYVRVVGASVACIAALGWIAERAFGMANPVRPALIVVLTSAVLGAAAWHWWASAEPRSRAPGLRAASAEEQRNALNSGELAA